VTEKENKVMAKTSNKTSNKSAPVATVAPVVAVEVNDLDKSHTVTLPKGTKITSQTVIAPPHVITANKERWFAKKRLQSFKQNTDGTVTITLRKGDLAYRQMLAQDAIA
jgi:hypothetical protein